MLVVTKVDIASEMSKANRANEMSEEINELYTL